MALNIWEAVRGYLGEHVPVPLRHLIAPDATFEELQLDALAAVELALLVEEQDGGDEVPDGVLEQWASVADVLAYYAGRECSCMPDASAFQR